MSTYWTFANLPAALAAFAAGHCRRHVEIDGHVIDLVHAEAEARRVREEPTGEFVGSLSLMWLSGSGALVPITTSPSREDHDRAVAANIAAWLQNGTDAVKAIHAAPVGLTPVELPPLAEPALPAADDASAYRCPWCSRPWDGAP